MTAEEFEKISAEKAVKLQGDTRLERSKHAMSLAKKTTANSESIFDRFVEACGLCPGCPIAVCYQCRSAKCAFHHLKLGKVDMSFSSPNDEFLVLSTRARDAILEHDPDWKPTIDAGTATFDALNK
eukprot:11279806-Prorocentrum_lima.AAC.1